MWIEKQAEVLFRQKKKKKSTKQMNWMGLRARLLVSWKLNLTKNWLKLLLIGDKMYAEEKKWK